MKSILVINLMLSFFDNRFFFDEEYVKFLKYKNSIISIEYKIPETKFVFLSKTEENKTEHKYILFNNLKPIRESFCSLKRQQQTFATDKIFLKY